MSQKRKTGQRLGWKGYASILRFIQRRTPTTAEVQEHFGMHKINAHRLMRRMHVLKLVHIGDWQLRPSRKGHAPVWRFGPGVDAPYAGKVAPPAAKPSNNMAAEMIGFATIIRVLAEPVTQADIAAMTGSSPCSISALLRHMRQIGLARIADWLPRLINGSPAALWTLGSTADAKRPQPLTYAEMSRRKRAANRARDEMHALLLATGPKPTIASGRSLEAEAA